jgi:hypothetical protein
VRVEVVTGFEVRADEEDAARVRVIRARPILSGPERVASRATPPSRCSCGCCGRRRPNSGSRGSCSDRLPDDPRGTRRRPCAPCGSRASARRSRSAPRPT